MSFGYYTVIALSSTLIWSCMTNGDHASVPTEIPGDKTDIYANEYGEIRLTPGKDSSMKVVFLNNKGDEYKTDMELEQNSTMLYDNTKPFLKWETGGLKLDEGFVEVHEFSNVARLGIYIQIPHVYERAFFLLGDTVEIQDVVEMTPQGPTLHGIYLNTDQDIRKGVLRAKGIIRKEMVPSEAGDSEHSFRLVMTPFSIEVVEPYLYEGSIRNIEGRAAFIWDFADSEAYYLDGHEPWKDEELDKRIKIRAVLFQFIDGRSVLRDWEIIE